MLEIFNKQNAIVILSLIFKASLKIATTCLLLIAVIHCNKKVSSYFPGSNLFPGYTNDNGESDIVGLSGDWVAITKQYDDGPTEKELNHTEKLELMRDGVNVLGESTFDTGPANSLHVVTHLRGEYRKTQLNLIYSYETSTYNGVVRFGSGTMTLYQRSRFLYVGYRSL